MPSVGQLTPCGARTYLMPGHGERSTSDTMGIRHDDSGGYNALGGEQVAMDTRTDAAASPRAADVHRPVVAANRPGLKFIPYGIAMGPVATAIGALVAERWGGMTRVVVWATVTMIFAVGAVFLAEPGLVILSRFFRTTRNR